MTTIAALGTVVGVLLLPLLIAAVRHPSLPRMAVRNINRRRGEALLVVAGSLLGTAIITSSFVVGDIVDGSMTDTARTQLGPVDITLTAPSPDVLDDVLAAVEGVDVDGVEDVLAAWSVTAALEAPGDAQREARAVPSTSVVELDPEAARGFGGDPAITGLSPLDADVLTGETIVLNERTADRLDVADGDRVRLHLYGTSIELTVAAVLPEVGLAGYGGALVAPGTLAELAADPSVPAAPPRAQVLVSLDGGVFDTRPLSAPAVEQLRAAVAEVPGVQVEAVKTNLLDTAEREGAALSELFTLVGSFSVLAGILLLVNLFVMLAEERKVELGMLRAIGFTRQRLTRAFAIEGALYAIMAAVAGTVAGVGVGWAVATTAGRIFGLADAGMQFRLVVEPDSLITGGLTGLVISLVTIWITSVRIARLNVIRAIRDLPDPTRSRVSRKALVAGVLGMLAGAALLASGIAEDDALTLMLSVPVIAFSASPLLRALLPERLARGIVAAAALGWGLGVFSLFPGIFSRADLEVFIVQGVVLTAGAVMLASTLDVVWARLVERLAVRGRGLASRLGLAYPLARRFRTSMLLGMFSLVIFTMTFIASLSQVFSDQAEQFTEEAAAGYDLLIDSNVANPVTTEGLLARDEVVAVAGLSRTWARYETSFTVEPRGWLISGFDDSLLGHELPKVISRDPAFGSDRDLFEAALADPGLALVPETFLQDGAPTSDRLVLGDTFSVLDPITGEPHELTVAAILGADWLFNGVFVSRELTGAMFGPQDVASRHYVAVADDVDAEALATRLDVELLPNGGEAATFASLVDEGMRQQNSFMTLLQAFLGLGLLVGIAGLGVVMSRAVRERRQQIGMLRALGFQTRLVRSAFLAEAGLIALQGTIVGSTLGLATARQVFTSSDAFGESFTSFAIPWVGLAFIVLLPIAAALAATSWPATRAAAIRPAVALRVAD